VRVWKRALGRGGVLALCAPALSVLGVLVLAVWGTTGALAQDGAEAETADGRTGAQASAVDLRPSVVKIFTTARGPDLTRPWSRQSPQEFSGSGLVIEGGRILTNAHVVEYGQQIFVQPYLSSRRLAAQVVARNAGIDLAVLRLERPEELEGVPAASLHEGLPDIGDTVNAFGYPIGGDELSITEGIVSRIEFVTYRAGTLGLRVQVDAALNPGNSGGPVAVDGRVIGLTFSGIDQAENIGYVIPTEEIELFLADAGDGSIEGRPFLREIFDDARNPALRDKLGLTRELEGMVVARSREAHPLRPWDVVVSIAGHDIDSQGLVQVTDDLRLYFEYFVQHELNEDGTVTLDVLRDGERLEVRSPVVRDSESVFASLDNEYPSYFVFGPLAFTPVYQAHVLGLNLQSLAARDSPIARLAFASEGAGEVEQHVVLAGQMLNHRINQAYEVQPFSVLKSVNGTTVRSLRHLVETLREQVEAGEEYLVFEFYDRGADRLVYRTEQVVAATEDVLEENGIRRQLSRDLEDAWPGL